MLKHKLLTALLTALSVGAPVLALAEESTVAAPTVTSNVALVSNYLYRGISQTGGNPAIQGGFDYAHSSGFYAGAWGSSISWISDATIATNAGLELDTYFGFKNSFATDYSYDVGFLRYNYPGNYPATATTIPGITTAFDKADTNEVYALIGYKWFTLKYSDSLGSAFAVPNAAGSSYIDLSANYPIGDSGVTLGAHAGRQSFVGTTADALRMAGQDPSYSDYKLSVTKDFSGYAVGLAYSTTTAQSGSGQYYNVNNKDLGRSTAILSLARTF